MSPELDNYKVVEEGDRRPHLSNSIPGLTNEHCESQD